MKYITYADRTDYTKILHTDTQLHWHNFHVHCPDRNLRGLTRPTQLKRAHIGDVGERRSSADGARSRATRGRRRSPAPRRPRVWSDACVYVSCDESLLTRVRARASVAPQRASRARGPPRARQRSARRTQIVLPVEIHAHTLDKLLLLVKPHDVSTRTPSAAVETHPYLALG